MTEEGFLRLKSTILKFLDDKLDPHLTYHSPKHTEDVLSNAVRIATAENISDPRSLLLIKIAALFHDTGFIDKYIGHEERSCEIMLDMLDTTEFTEEEMKQICSMIMATKIPQSPTRLEEKILCDADLDYLGREDFDIINNRLKRELLAYGFIQNENDWNPIQLKFLESHSYFTNSSVNYRNPVKRTHIAAIKKDLLNGKPNPY